MDRRPQKANLINRIEEMQLSEELADLLSVLDQDPKSDRRIDEVERELFVRLLNVGRILLKRYGSSFGNGDEGEQVMHEEHGRLVRSETQSTKTYQSIFGEFEIERWTYHKRIGQKAFYRPIDQRLGLPVQKQSYVLEDWLQRMVVKETYHEAVEGLKTLLNLSTSVRTAERMNRDLAAYEKNFRAEEDFSNDETLLVVTADGKGVPMRKSLNQRKHEQFGTKLYEAQNTLGYEKSEKRRTAGANKSTKQSAYVGAVYSIRPFVRTTDDVMDELRRERRKSQRPRPVNKRLSVEMTQVTPEGLVEGPQQLFASLKSQVDQRLEHRTLVCLMDGQRSLWYQQRESLPNAIAILDLFHAMEYLWTAAHCFEPKGSLSAEKFVNRYLRKLLDGQVKSVISALKRKRKELKGKNLKTLEKVINYYTKNQAHMQYDTYLHAGYPIGSGVVEGACRHLVKDRMERSGMRWQTEGAIAMLRLRSTYLNGNWRQFLDYRIKNEQNQLYANAA